MHPLEWKSGRRRPIGGFGPSALPGGQRGGPMIESERSVDNNKSVVLSGGGAELVLALGANLELSRGRIKSAQIAPV